MAASNEAFAIASIMARSFAEYESSYTPEAFAATISTPDRIRDRINEGPVWVALRNDAVVGTLSAVARGKALYLRGMAVDPTARGDGIGRRLLDRAEEYAIRNGFERLFLSTTPFLKSAIRLYESYGFVAATRSLMICSGRHSSRWPRTCPWRLNRRKQFCRAVTTG